MKQLAMEEANDGTTGSSGGASEKKRSRATRSTDRHSEGIEAAPQGAATEGATSTAPGADEGAAASAASDPVPTGPQFTPGAVALVTKGIDRLPVQLRDQAHLDSLIASTERAAWRCNRDPARVSERPARHDRRHRGVRVPVGEEAARAHPRPGSRRGDDRPDGEREGRRRQEGEDQVQVRRHARPGSAQQLEAMAYVDPEEDPANDPAANTGASPTSTAPTRASTCRWSSGSTGASTRAASSRC
jgi:hypothetical protein